MMRWMRLAEGQTRLLIKEKRERREKGVITVFFSLILLVILSLITTMVESARLSACNGIAGSIVELSAKSLLSSYYLPLYENYHVFGYWNEGEELEAHDGLTSEFRWYLQQNVGNNAWLDMEMTMAGVEDVTVLTERNGAFFYEQALQYSKYQGVELAAEQILEALGVLSQTDNTAYVLQKKYEAESSAAKAENTVLLLAGCIDGFVVEDGFFQRNWLGRLKTSDSFVKKLVPGLAGQASVYLESKELYKAQKSHYENPSELLTSIQKYKTEIEESREILSILCENEAELEKEYQNHYENFEEEDVNRKYLEESLEQIRKSIAEYGQHISGLIGNCSIRINRLQRLVRQTEERTAEALELLRQIKEEKEAARSELEAYVQELEGEKEQLQPELYEELLLESQSILEEYQKENSIGMIADISALEEALLHNQECLEGASASLGYLNPGESGSGSWNQYINMAAAKLESLELEAFQFKYEQLFAAEEENNFTELAGQLMEYGVLALVLEKPEEISDAYMSGEELPSERYVKRGTKEKNIELSDLLSGELEAGSTGYGEKAVELLNAGAEALLEQLLYQIYLTEHFPAYVDFLEESETETAEEKEGKVAGLLYQREYIIGGEEQDSSNLANVASKMLFLRFMLNLTTILCNHECRAQAKSAAVSIVGFTGISALVSVLQFLIELIWAAECALIECAALFMGGECAFFTSGSKLAVSFSELLAFNRTTMFTKAEALKKNSAAGVLKDYDGYLIMFSLFQNKELRTLRTMDVIQQVMQLNYSSDFRFSDCIGGVAVKAEFEIPYRFLIYDREKRGGRGIQKTISYGISY